MKQARDGNGQAADQTAPQGDRPSGTGQDSLELALIVGAARSGTTLLRMLLDAHPEIGCPAEAGLPSLMSHMVSLWMTIDADHAGAKSGEDPGATPPEGTVDRPEVTGNEADQPPARDPLADVPDEALEWVRAAVCRPMLRYNRRDGKRLYVDKSLDSVHHLRLVNGLFPGTRCVLLVRHVMDTIASGIEASPWGFHAYGYAPYVQAMAGNNVAALAQYWLTHISAALDWEREQPDVCHRVRYEDLVLRPEETVSGIQEFLGVRRDLSVLESAFRRSHPRGPGDYKVGHTRAVHQASIGHGKRVPVSMLPPGLLEAINEKMEILGYLPLSPAWNAEERIVDAGGDGIWAKRLSGVMDDARISSVPMEDIGSFALVAEDHRELRWVVQPDVGSIAQGDGEVELVVTGTAEDLVLMLTEEANPGVLLRSGRIRHLTASDDNNHLDIAAVLDQVIQLFRGEKAFLTSNRG